jgi:hypothetical protein
MDRVHISMDRPVTLGPPWTDTDADSGHGGVLTGAQSPAVAVRESSPAGAQQREERTGSSIRASPGLERRRGGRAMMVQNGEAAVLGESAAQAGRDGNRSGERCAKPRGGCSPYIGARGAPGRGGRGG